MKKSTALLLAAIIAFTLCACGSTGSAAVTDSQPSPAIPVEETEPAEVYDAAAAAVELMGAGYVDPSAIWGNYDGLIAAVEAEPDTAKRAELMHKAEALLMSNYCVIPLYYYNDVYLQKDYVSGIYSNKSGTKFFMYSVLTNGASALRVSLSSEPASLDPALVRSMDEISLAANAFSGLYTYNADGETVPACAAGYDVSNDGLIYTVTLKDGLRWSDGSALTAADFAYSWKRAASSEISAPYAAVFSVFEGFDSGELNVTALDDSTLQFVLSSPCADMEERMAFPALFPVCKACVEAASSADTPDSWCADSGFVSNGAFICTGWEHGSSMTYEKNPYWFDAESVTVDTLECTLSSDDTAVFTAFSTGALDFADTIPSDKIAALLADGNAELHAGSALSTYFLAFNVKSPLFEGRTPEQAACMRRAFSLLFDRDFLCEYVDQSGQAAANAFIPLGMSDGNGGTFKSSAIEEGFYDPYAINNDYDAAVAEALELLRAAGFEFDEKGYLSGETPIRINYVTDGSPLHAAVAESLKLDLSVLGIEVTVLQQSRDLFCEDLSAGNFDAVPGEWIYDFDDPLSLLQIWTSASGGNICRFGR